VELVCHGEREVEGLVVSEEEPLKRGVSGSIRSQNKPSFETKRKHSNYTIP